MEGAPGFFESYFLWRDSLAAATIAAALCAFVGVYIVLRRTVFVSAALSQISGMGVATAFFLASVLGIDPHAVPWYIDPLSMAMAFAAAGAALFSLPLGRRRLASETTVGIGYLVASAAVILILNSPRVGQEAHEINDLLYGNAVAILPGTLGVVVATAVVVLGAHCLFYKDLVFVSFDAEMARTLGYRTWVWNLLLFESFAVAISVSTRAIGALPVFGMMILPAAAALLLGRRMWQVFALAVGFAVVGTAVGYYVSWHWLLPTGASMVVVTALFLAPGLVNLMWRGQ
jgi:zinc transport system permease protein